jgi:hypothetical protein
MELLLIIGLTLLNGGFAMAEMALSSSRKARLLALEEAGAAGGGGSQAREQVAAGGWAHEIWAPEAGCLLIANQAPRQPELLCAGGGAADGA